MIDEKILNALNAKSSPDRLDALKQAVQTANMPPVVDRYINNHIHTSYSFSPYSPAAAVYAARAEGLATAGIVDHDSMGGAKEFIAAGDIVGMPVTVGFECRVSMAGSPFAHIRTNNPDQKGVSYVVVHGVPHAMIDRVQEFFAPLRAFRNERNKKMTDGINALLSPFGISLDFERDILPLSMYSDGGTVTERHLMMALARMVIQTSGRGEGVISLLSQCGISLSGSQKAMMANAENMFYEYDLLGILKSSFIPKIYIDAADECPSLRDVVALAAEIGGIFCYSYLGDVGESPTGDKKAQKFEDEYLDELVEYLYREGVRAMTYMPTRNTKEQIVRLRALCSKYGMFQVSGEDINSPRQSFICRAMDDPMFSDLIDSTWALIKHELGKKKIML